MDFLLIPRSIFGIRTLLFKRRQGTFRLPDVQTQMLRRNFTWPLTTVAEDCGSETQSLTLIFPCRKTWFHGHIKIPLPDNFHPPIDPAIQTKNKVLLRKYELLWLCKNIEFFGTHWFKLAVACGLFCPRPPPFLRLMQTCVLSSPKLIFVVKNRFWLRRVIFISGGLWVPSSS